MLGYDFKEISNDSARKVFDVPGNRVVSENGGFAIDMRKRAARSSGKLNVEIIFHTAERIVPHVKAGNNHQPVYYGGWLNYLEGYKIPELSELVFADFADARVLLGHYRKDEDGLIHFYVFRSTGEPYFREGGNDEYRPGIYIVERRIGSKRDQANFNSRYNPLLEIADYSKLTLPTSASRDMEVFSAFVVPMHGCLTDFAYGRSERTIIQEYRKIYRNFLRQRSVPSLRTPELSSRKYDSDHLFFNAKAYVRGFVVNWQGDIVEPTRIIPKTNAPKALVATEQYWDNVSPDDLIVEVSVIDSDSPHYSFFGNRIINEEQLDALAEIKRIVGEELKQSLSSQSA